jgi:hypothetical protein
MILKHFKYYGSVRSGRRVIYIGYRRGRDQQAAGRLYEALIAHFGPDRVFLDTGSIPPGVQFESFYLEKLESCYAFVAVIGPGWIENIDRLWDNRDHVRAEIVPALARADVRVIPVRIDGTPLPEKERLPPDMQPLVKWNGIPLPHEGYSEIIKNRLVPALKERRAGLRRAFRAATVVLTVTMLSVAGVLGWLELGPEEGSDQTGAGQQLSDMPEPGSASDASSRRTPSGPARIPGLPSSADQQNATRAQPSTPNKSTTDSRDTGEKRFERPAPLEVVSDRRTPVCDDGSLLRIRVVRRASGFAQSVRWYPPNEDGSIAVEAGEVITLSSSCRLELIRTTRKLDLIAIFREIRY